MEKDREDFEKWWQGTRWGEMTLTGVGLKMVALDTLEFIQPEIDALNDKLRSVTELSHKTSRMLNENDAEVDALRAEIERLWNALQSPESIIALIGSNFSSRSESQGGDPASVKYVLTVHDLVSAFSSLFEDTQETK